LIVSDGQLDSEPVSTVITATGPANQPPVADAGRDIAVATGDAVRLDGTDSSDPDGDTLSYSWSLVDQPAASTADLSDADRADPSLSTDVDGTYQVQLIVSDGELESDPDVVIVTAATGNVPPNANAGPDQTVEMGDVVQLDGTDSDDNEGDALTFDWKFSARPQDSSAQLDDPTSPAPTFFADVVGDYEVELVVNDGESDSTTDTVTITAVDPNREPTANAGVDQEGRVGDTVVLDGSGSDDPDGDTLQHSWSWVFKPASSSATLEDATTDAASFTPDAAGTYTIGLTVNDGSVDSAADMVTVTVLDAFPTMEGDVVITEFMANPQTESDKNGEWFEIYNPTSTTWNLRDCVLQDRDIDSHTIDQSVVVRPMTYVTFARAGSPGFGPDYVYGNELPLANDGDELVIVCESAEIAAIEYVDGAGYDIVAGVSLALLRGMDETDNDDSTNWCLSTTDYNGDSGTPGAPNEFQSSCPP
jgi:hypothetical protein